MEATTTALGSDLNHHLNYIVSGSGIRDNSEVIFKVDDNGKHSWRSFQINYLISGRQDIAIGNLDRQNSQVSYLSEGVYQASSQIHRHISSSVSVKVAAFISGFVTKAPVYELGIIKSELDHESETVIVRFQSSLQFGKFSFSFIVFPDSHPLFTFSYGLYLNNQSPYYLNGAVSTEQGSVEEFQWRIENSLECAKRNCTAGFYFRKGFCHPCHPEAIDCSSEYIATACPPGYVLYPIQFSGMKVVLCLKSCKGYTCFNKNRQNMAYAMSKVQYTPEESEDAVACREGLTGGGGNCQQCLPGQRWDGADCVCLDGYDRIDGECNKCQPNETHNGTDCVCLDGYYRIDGECSKCQPNETHNGTDCVCLDGYYRIDELCSFLCTRNQIWNGINCVCKKDHYNISGLCQRCRVHEKWNGSQCTCEYGFKRDIYGVCGLHCGCPPNSAWNAEQELCECIKKGDHMINGECRQCAVGETWYRGVCVCSEATFRIDGRCQVCASQQRYDGIQCVCDYGYSRHSSGFCILRVDCPTKSYFGSDYKCKCRESGKVLIDGDCQICPGESKISSDGHSCVCIQNYFRINGTCEPCISQFQHMYRQCACKEGFQRNQTGLCTRMHIDPNHDSFNCTRNETWNGTACECASENFRINGSCQTCPKYWRYNGTECVCQWGFSLDRDGDCVLQCECPQGSYFDTLTLNCTCEQVGSKLIDGACKRCQVNQAWWGTICQCKAGYERVNGTCLHRQNCAPGFYFHVSEYSDQPSCQPCPATALECESKIIDTKCQVGYSIKSGSNRDGQKYALCIDCGVRRLNGEQASFSMIPCRSAVNLELKKRGFETTTAEQYITDFLHQPGFELPPHLQSEVKDPKLQKNQLTADLEDFWPDQQIGR